MLTDKPAQILRIKVAMPEQVPGRLREVISSSTSAMSARIA